MSDGRPESPPEVGPRARRSALLFLGVAGSVLWIPVGRAALGRPPGFIRDLGFVSGPGGTLLAWLLGLAVGVGYSAFAVRNTPLVRRYWRSPVALKALAIVVALAAAIVEEAFFRRLVMDWTRGAGGGAALQIVGSGLVFGLAHGTWGLATGRVAVGVGAMISTGILGAALGVVYLAGGRSLAPPIASHFIVTAVIQPGILFAAFSGQMRGRPRSPETR